MTKVQLSPVNQKLFLIFELDQAVECLRTALERIAGGRTVLRDDSATLFLLANGLERFLKVSVHILHFDRHGQFVDASTMMGTYRHNLKVLSDGVLAKEKPDARATARGREDLAFVKTDELLARLLNSLDGFARTDRYFMLDGVAGVQVDPNQSPTALWEEVLSSVAEPAVYMDAEQARAIVAPRLVACIQRYLRCLSQAVCDSTTGDARSLASGMFSIHGLKDADLETPIGR